MDNFTAKVLEFIEQVEEDIDLLFEETSDEYIKKLCEEEEEND